jgi:hypothetical protein
MTIVSHKRSGQPERGDVEPLMETLSNALERLVDQGFTAHFGVVGDRLRAFASEKTFRAHELIIREFQRFEGVSDPDDMAIVYAVETTDGTRGSLVDAFGAYSSPAVSAFLHDVPMGRASAPGAAART